MKRNAWAMLAGLALGGGSLAAEPPGDSFFNDRKLNIPITMPANLRKEITKLTLFVSTDQGKTWRQEMTAGPADEKFEFNAASDGPHWFNVAYTDKAGTSSPRETEIYNGPPQLKVVIDTRPPVLKLEVTERAGDLVSLAWEAKDDALDDGRTRLEFKPEGSSEWRPLDLGSNVSKGQKRFTVGTTGPVSVRYVAADLAGNASQQQVEATQTTTSSESSKQSVGRPTSLSSEPPTLPSAPASSAPALPPTLPTAQSGAEAFRPAAPVAPPASPPAPASDGTRPVASAASPSTRTNVPMAEASQPGRGGVVPLAASSPASAPANNTHRSAAGPLLHTNQLSLELDYEIPKMGPSGVGSVELWVTQDNGRTWKRAGEKQDPQPPFKFDAPGEGVYGFTMIVKNRAGIGRKEPGPGDQPELRVEVDTTPPTAALYPVEADYSRKDTLYLIWKVEDKNLTATPIRMQWAKEQGGPWQDVAPDLANSGRHKWKMPEDLPYRIYLRLEARDLAGNVSVAETPEPVLVDLTEPEIRIKGLVPKKQP